MEDAGAVKVIARICDADMIVSEVVHDQCGMKGGKGKGSNLGKGADHIHGFALNYHSFHGRDGLCQTRRWVRAGIG